MAAPKRLQPKSGKSAQRSEKVPDHILSTDLVQKLSSALLENSKVSSQRQPGQVLIHLCTQQDKSYPMPWQGAYSGASHHDIAKPCRIVCRLHELIREQVWKIRRPFHSNIYFRSRDLARSFYIRRQFEMAPRNVRPACQGMGYKYLRTNPSNLIAV